MQMRNSLEKSIKQPSRPIRSGPVMIKSLIESNQISDISPQWAFAFPQILRGTEDQTLPRNTWRNTQDTQLHGIPHLIDI